MYQPITSASSAQKSPCECLENAKTERKVRFNNEYDNGYVYLPCSVYTFSYYFLSLSFSQYIHFTNLYIYVHIYIEMEKKNMSMGICLFW